MKISPNISALILFLLIIFSGIFESCSNDDVDYGYLSDKFSLDFATVLFENNSPILALDSEDTLRSSEISSFDFTQQNGQRVLVNHSPDDGDGIVIHSISDINTSHIQTAELDTLAIDPLKKVQSVWLGGGYLNMILYINYYSTTHKLGLYRSSDAPNQLLLSHDKQGDSEGYPVKVYVSFLLNGLQSSVNDTTYFSVEIPTFSGISTYDFSYR